MRNSFDRIRRVVVNAFDPLDFLVTVLLDF